MRLTLQEAKARLRLSDDVLRQALGLLVDSLDELERLHDVAADCSPEQARAAWTAYYRCLHGIKPVLQMITGRESHENLRSLCDDLARGEGTKMAAQIRAFQTGLTELRTDLQSHLQTQATA
jgi:hypothetical protein